MQPANRNKPPLRFRKLRIAWSVVWFLAAAILMATYLHRQYLFDRSPYGYAPAKRSPIFSDYRESGRWSLFFAGLAFLPLLPRPRRFSTRDLFVAVMLISIALALIVRA